MFLGSGVILFTLFVVAEAQKILQQEIISATLSVEFSCKVSGMTSSDYIHWYHKKEGGTLNRVLLIDSSGSSKSDTTDNDNIKKGSTKNGLKISSVEKKHAGIYYCAYYDSHSDIDATIRRTQTKQQMMMTQSGNSPVLDAVVFVKLVIAVGSGVKVFGSGTELVVSDDKIEKIAPAVIVYPPPKPQDGKTALVCIAKGMIPAFVRFKWKEEGQENSEAEVLEHKIEDGSASILIIEEMKARVKHTCTVEHEGTEHGNTWSPTGRVN
ncbi:immunoglobulin lambda-1 light chain-like [Conger conger]|uniref:immunoglobulin lambda-1 light chain-like n=1 Tax=Conger conger TaxID=82655 RepID=UPI002A5A9B6E|nr:immunoglobulin lambda-1 light chain-like [Conger conger]